LAVPGEDLVVPLDVEQGWGGDPPGIPCDALRYGQALMHGQSLPKTELAEDHTPERWSMTQTR
jgi:hypothetical protein